MREVLELLRGHEASLVADDHRAPHAPAMDTEDALDEIRRGSGTQFAPAVAQAMPRLRELEPVAV